MFSNIAEKIIIAILSAIILGVLIAAWGVVVDGGLISALGGVTQSEQTRPLQSGAVVAFDLDTTECPEGWSKFAQAQSRTIIGASFKDIAIEKRLSEYPRHGVGGEENFLIEKKNLPKHKHRYDDVYFAENKDSRSDKTKIKIIPLPDDRGNKGTDNDNEGWVLDRETKDFGDFGQEEQFAISIVQPYIALFYCKKN